jgi:hypothetical protein
LTEAEFLEGETDFPRSKVKALIRWRRETVWELKSFGLTIDEIVQNLRPKDGIKISHATVWLDIHTKEKQIQMEFSNHIQRLTGQNNLALTRVRRVIKEAGRIYANDQSKAKDMLPIILRATEIEQQLLGDPTQLERALKLVNQFKKMKSGGESNDTEGREPPEVQQEVKR